MANTAQGDKSPEKKEEPAKETPKQEAKAKTEIKQEAKAKPDLEVKSLAEKIFIQMCANNPRGFEPHHFAARAYVMAKSFVEHEPSDE